MPIYAFECTNCGHTFDRLQKMADADPTTCPVCGKETVKRAITAPSFRLSGSGWYETDFKKDGDKKKNLTGEASKPAESKPAEAKPAESKPSTSSE
jgi:putative FmdB family regulatory protein